MTIAYHVYASPSSGLPIDYGTPVATVYGTTFQTQALPFPGLWSFGVRAFDDATGLEEANIDAAVTISFGSTGADVSGLPVPPAGLAVLPRSSGSFLVRWTYPFSGNPPVGFHVYAGVGTPSYAAPAATVLAADGSLTPSYSAVLSGLTDGTTYAVVVRSYNASGEEANTNLVSAVARVNGPAIVGSLSVTAIA